MGKIISLKAYKREQVFKKVKATMTPRNILDIAVKWVGLLAILAVAGLFVAMVFQALGPISH